MTFETKNCPKCNRKTAINQLRHNIPRYENVCLNCFCEYGCEAEKKEGKRDLLVTEYLDKWFPKQERSLVRVLSLGGRELKGDLDVSDFINLEELWCHNNELTSLNISKNEEITRLICHGNNFSNLDISKNKKLVEIECEDEKFDTVNRLRKMEICLKNQKKLVEDICRNIAEKEKERKSRLVDNSTQTDLTNQQIETLIEIQEQVQILAKK